MTKEAEVLNPEVHLSSAGRMSGGDRRQQILAVAVDLFSRKGFSGTTTKEIAAAAGVSEAIIFRHFATKEELYSAIIDNAACTGRVNPFEAVEDACQRRDDFAVFETAALALLNFHEANPSFQRLLLHSGLECHQLAQMFWATTVRETYEFLGSYIRERQVEGAIREKNPLLLVQAFLGMVIHYSLIRNLWGRPSFLPEMSNQEAASYFAEVFLKGIEIKTAE